MIRRLFFITILLVLCASDSFASPNAQRAVKKGNMLYNKEKYEDALKKYEDALLAKPDSDVVNFDIGTALYKTGSYEAAITHFEKALTTDDKLLEEKAGYNAGNAEYKFGISKEEKDLPKAVDLLKQSLRHYENAIKINSKAEDAKYNYEFVKKELERLEAKLKKQKEQQQKEQKGQGEKKEGGENQQSEQKKQAENEQQGSQEEQAEKKQPESGQGKKQEDQEKQSGEKKQEKEQGQQEKPTPESREKSEIPEKPPAGASAAGAVGEDKQMSEEHAKALLREYRSEEEPQELFQEKLPLRAVTEPKKDW